MTGPFPRRVALIRHGEYHQQRDTPSAHQPHPLTREGEVHAEAGAQEVLALCHLHGWQIEDCLHSSTLLRAWQTGSFMAATLERALGQPFKLITHDVLCERGLGSAANLTARQIEHVISQDPRMSALPNDWKSNSHYRLPLPGAESLLQAGERVAAYLHALPLPASSASLTLVIGHGAAFRHAAHLLGVLAFEEIARLSMHHGRPVILEEVLLEDVCEAEDDNALQAASAPEDVRTTTQWRHVAGEWKQRKLHESARD